MNQSILFPNIQEWDKDKRVVEFPAQHGGALIGCSISIEKLKVLSGKSSLNDVDAMEVFSQYRFDIEEIAEEMIEDEVFNELDHIEIIESV